MPRSKNAPAASEPSFEEAIGRLDAVVEEMESADLPLDQLIERYGEGIKLVETCSQKLKAAEVQVQELTQQSQKALQPLVDQGASDSDDELMDEEEPSKDGLF